MTPHFPRHFTLAEANALIPWVCSVLDRAHRILSELSVEEPASDPTPPPPVSEEGGNGNGRHGAGIGGEKGSAQIIGLEEIWSDLDRQAKVRLVDGLLRALIEEGIVIQDVPRGLVDFPGLRADGTEFLFCYEPTDGPRIRYWHNLTDGYAGRRPLEELDR